MAYAKAQFNFHGQLEAEGIYTSNGQIPFWMRANQFGSIPLNGTSSSLIGNIYKQYDSSKKKVFDWGMGLEVRANFGSASNFLLIEAYGKLRVGVFQLKAGRSKDVMGLVGDSSLSSGSFSVSGNALGIPKVELAIPQYSYVFGGRMIAFKGNFAHGWIGDVPIQFQYRRPGSDMAFTYLHQSSLYMRIGKPEWKLKLYGGMNHNVFWGHEGEIFYPVDFNMSVAKSYLYVITGKKDIWSSIGNHLGSIDAGMSIDMKDVQLMLYRQSFYDKNNLFHLANLLDGLNGITLIHYQRHKPGIHWRKILLEVMYSANQAGEPWSNTSASGEEDYYNNYVYAQGWSYKGAALGNSFISQRGTVRNDLPNSSGDYFINNRVLLFHTGAEGEIGPWVWMTKLSFSRNYGTYATSVYGRSLDHKRAPSSIIFTPVNQFSGYIETSRPLKSHWQIGAVAALNYGKLLYNSAGVLLKFSKSF